MKPPFTLLTDFGTADPFSGSLKGVLSTLAPENPILDLSHEIPPGDLLKAAITLWQAYKYFPDGTIFVCVVDPGVGTSRRAMLVQSGGYTFVGPDNGIFSFVLGEDFKAWELRNSTYFLPNAGNTFHGRDIFAAAAAHFARGIPAESMGPEITDLTWLAPPTLKSTGGNCLVGQILYPDHFGNLLTSLGCFHMIDPGKLMLKPWLPTVVLPESQIASDQLELILPGNQVLSMVDTFSSVEPGECAFLIGSSGLLEIVSNRQRAIDILGINRGDLITLRSAV